MQVSQRFEKLIGDDARSERDGSAPPVPLGSFDQMFKQTFKNLDYVLWKLERLASVAEHGR